jgi:hypothetical protein
MRLDLPGHIRPVCRPARSMTALGALRRASLIPVTLQGDGRPTVIPTTIPGSRDVGPPDSG